MASKIVSCLPLHKAKPWSKIRANFPTCSRQEASERAQGGAAPVESEDKTSNQVKVFRERGTRNETGGTFDLSQDRSANTRFHSLVCKGVFKSMIQCTSTPNQIGNQHNLN